MKQVYYCKSCGFISTRRGEYTYIDNVMVCKNCKEDYDRGDESVVRWANEKKDIKELEK